MKFEQVEMTPELAQMLLDTSTDIQQRSVRKARVELFARDMREGNWQLTHQPIAIDADGRLIDGQHRCRAVVLSGVTVTMMIAHEADATTFGVIDTGSARMPSDALKIAGLTNVNIKASAARLLLAYDRIKGTRDRLGTAGKLVSSAEIQAVYHTERGERILAAETPAAYLAGQLGRYGIKTWGLVLHVLAQESELLPGTRAEFFERFADGAMLAPMSPILALRRYVINDTGLWTQPSQERPAYFLANAIRSLNDYTHGRERQAVMWRPGIQDMPTIELPDAKLLELDAEARERADHVKSNARSRQRKAAAASTQRRSKPA
jgi:hypothetical protein